MLLSMGFNLGLALACSTPATICVYCLVGIVNYNLGIAGAIPLLWGSLVALLSIIVIFNLNSFSFRHKIQTLQNNSVLNEIPIWLIVLYVTVSLTLITVQFLYNAGGPDAFIRYNDNHSHLAWIKNMAESGNYSTLNVTFYDQSDSNVPFQGSSYYPIGFHVVPALAKSITGLSTPIVENGAAVVFCGVSFPLCLSAFIFKVFQGSKVYTAMGSVVGMASVAFPLRMLAVHGPFPNIAGFSCVPAVILLFMELFDDSQKKVTILYLPTFCVVALGLALLHPNALIFACLGMLAYWMVHVIPMICRQVSLAPLKTSVLIGEVTTVIFAAAIWYIVHQLPFMQSIVNFYWEWNVSFNEIVSSLFDGGLLLRIPQAALGVITVIGLFELLKSRHSSWLVLFYCLVAFIFVVTAISDKSLKSWISGFWYTDPERLAAMVAISEIPIASYGLGKSILLIYGKITNVVRLNKMAACSIISILIVAFCMYNYYPYVLYAGATNNTAFGQTFYDLNHAYSDQHSKSYSAEERNFISEVKQTIGTDALVLNLPADGSTYAYSVDDLNAYYHAISGVDESSDSQIIRSRLNMISDDLEVQQAVKNVGATYLLLLDRADFMFDGKETVYSSDLYLDTVAWRGILAVNDETPGFEIVLSSGPMRLYRIEVRE